VRSKPKYLHWEKLMQMRSRLETEMRKGKHLHWDLLMPRVMYLRLVIEKQKEITSYLRMHLVKLKPMHYYWDSDLQKEITMHSAIVKHWER
jgi:hypothetical protein